VLCCQVPQNLPLKKDLSFFAANFANFSGLKSFEFSFYAVNSASFSALKVPEFSSFAANRANFSA